MEFELTYNNDHWKWIMHSTQNEFSSYHCIDAIVYTTITLFTCVFHTLWVVERGLGGLVKSFPSHRIQWVLSERRYCYFHSSSAISFSELIIVKQNKNQWEKSFFRMGTSEQKLRRMENFQIQPLSSEYKFDYGDNEMVIMIMTGFPSHKKRNLHNFHIASSHTVHIGCVFGVFCMQLASNWLNFTVLNGICRTFLLLLAGTMSVNHLKCFIWLLIMLLLLE